MSFGTGWWRNSKTPGFGGGTDAGAGGAVSIVSDGVLAPFVTFTRSSTATYFDSAGVMQTATANTPRTDYDPVTHALRGLLLEEQRTNLVTYSQDFSNAAWTNTASVGGSVTAPDGTTTAQKFVPSANAQYFNSAGFTASDGQSMAVSVFFKPAGLDYVAVFVGALGVDRSGIIINLTTATLYQTYVTGSAAAPTNVNISSVGGGLYLATFVVVITTAMSRGVTVRNIAPSANANGSNGVYLWGVQPEVGAFATSYTPTTSAAVTRAADAASFTVPAGIIRLVTTYDDATTAATTVTPGATYNIPTGQKRIKRITGYRS